MSKQCTDHLGNTFKSFTDMCKYYNIDINTFYSRLKRGSSLEKALTTPVGENKSKSCTDHLGNRFESFGEMCRHYNVNRQLVRYRLKNGLSLEEALTKSKFKQCQDHLGNTFKSFSDMCKYHNVDYQTAYRHLKAGWTIEEVLTNKNYKQKHEQKNVS